jgi:transposase-like protein
MKPFNRFLKTTFGCDACQKQFQEKTAYSIAQDWEENLPTFCFNCVRIIQKANRPQKLDKRSLNKTGRTHQLATRVRKEFIRKLKRIARKEKLKYVEVLERALEAYSKNKI